MIDKLISKMTLREKIGQLIVGQAEGLKVTEEFKEYINRYPLGGYRINGQNIKDKEQVIRYTSEIKKIYSTIGCGIDPLLACDEEGGTPSVFRGLVTEFPGNMALGAAGDCFLAHLQGNVLANELSELGINMVFAPVADLNLNQNNPVIGVRSFGDNPDAVAQLCEAYAKGLNAGGIAACAKHFPGHGNTEEDSHYSLPSNNVSYEVLQDTELVPFSRLASLMIDSIMVSHVLYPKVDEENTPASLSRKLIGDVLRNKLKYDGVIITDDIEMQAIIRSYPVKEAVKRFIKAGGDIALINGSRGAVVDAFEGLLEAVEKGELEISRIEQSVQRVLELKKKISEYNLSRVKKFHHSTSLSEKISRKAITLIRDKENILPLREKSKVMLIVPNQVNLTEADTSGGMTNSLHKYIAPYASEVFSHSIDLERDCQIDEGVINKYDFIVQCTINSIRFPKQIKILEQISELKPTIAVMLRDPYEAALIPDRAAVIAAYSSIDNSMSALAALIYGEATFEGSLPVKI